MIALTRKVISAAVAVAAVTGALYPFPLVKSASAEDWGLWYPVGRGLSDGEVGTSFRPVSAPVQAMFVIGGTGKANVRLNDGCGLKLVTSHYSVQLPAAYVFTVITVNLKLPRISDGGAGVPITTRLTTCGLWVTFWPRTLPTALYERWPATRVIGQTPARLQPPAKAKFV
jgi:hypothetical protein